VHDEKEENKNTKRRMNREYREKEVKKETNKVILKI